LLDLRQEFERVVDPLEKETEKWLGLDKAAMNPTSPGDSPSVLFRVYVSPAARGQVAENGLYLFGNRPELGSWLPGAVALNDQGEGGDQIAGDGVYSARVAFDFSQNDQGDFAPETVEYAFLPFSRNTLRTPDGDPLAAVRTFLYYYHLPLAKIRVQVSLTTPVHVLGYCPNENLLLGGTDFIHPNRFGNARIAAKIFEVLQREEPWQVRLLSKK
jgi:hypothetical protein